jgi:hypothetical protein
MENIAKEFHVEIFYAQHHENDVVKIQQMRLAARRRGQEKKRGFLKKGSKRVPSRQHSGSQRQAACRNRNYEPIPVDEYIPCWRPSEAGTALIVVAWLATRPPHALSALLMNYQQMTLPTGIGSKRHPFKGASSQMR